MSWCRRWRTSTKESLVLWAQECQSLMLRCSATLTMFRVTLVWIVLPLRPLLSCISETYMYAWLPGLLPPESYRTCYYINYVPKSLMYLDGILVFYCWIGSLEFRRCVVLVLMPGLFSKSLWYRNTMNCIYIHQLLKSSGHVSKQKHKCILWLRSVMQNARS